MLQIIDKALKMHSPKRLNKEVGRAPAVPIAAPVAIVSKTHSSSEFASKLNSDAKRSKVPNSTTNILEGTIAGAFQKHKQNIDDQTSKREDIDGQNVVKDDEKIASSNFAESKTYDPLGHTVCKKKLCS